MNAVRSLAVWAVVAIGVATLIVNLIFHHHLGAQIFTGIAYLALAVALFFDVSTRPSPRSPFCKHFSPEEVKVLQINNLALLYPGAAHFYAGALTAFAMVGVLWAIAAILDHGYVTATLLVVYYFLTALENIRLAPQEHIAKSAAAGNPVAILRQIHWKSINDKLAAHTENQNAAAWRVLQRSRAQVARRDP